jgi:hypothetical protein
MLADKLLLLNWKRILLIIAAFVLAVILHNLVYVLFKGYFDSYGGDEAFFMIVALIVIPLYAAVALVFTAVRLLTRKAGSRTERPPF